MLATVSTQGPDSLQALLAKANAALALLQHRADSLAQVPPQVVTRTVPVHNTQWANTPLGIVILGVTYTVVAFFAVKRFQPRPPTADEIAEAYDRRKLADEDVRHEVASALYELLAQAMTCLQEHSRKLNEMKLLEDSDRQRFAAFFREWETLSAQVSVLRREDVVRQCDAWFRETLGTYDRILRDHAWLFDKVRQGLLENNDHRMLGARSAALDLDGARRNGSTIREAVGLLRPRSPAR